MITPTPDFRNRRDLVTGLVHFDRIELRRIDLQEIFRFGLFRIKTSHKSHSRTPLQARAAVGLPISFQASSGESHIFWNFGSSASKILDSSHEANDIVFSTGGSKTILVTSFAGCARIDTLLLDVLDCTTPVIPSWAVVIDTDQTSRISTGSLWVNPGVTLSLQFGTDTIYAETGSKIIGTSTSLVYLKRGAQILENNGLVIHDTSTSFSGDNLLCSGLTFNYSQAPPNVAFRNGVFAGAALSSIKVSPNPATGRVTISGLRKGISSMAIVNVLGASVMELRPEGRSSLPVELSSLPAGSYFVRIEAVNSVSTIRLVKE